MYLTKILFGLIMFDFVANSSEKNGNYTSPVKLKRHYLKKFYLPATIQILSHINDNLKFVLKPYVSQAVSVSATASPNKHQLTSSHRPGIISPFQLPDNDAAVAVPDQQPHRYRLNNVTSANKFAKIIFDLKELENQQLLGSEENKVEFGGENGNGDGEENGDEEFDKVVKFLTSFDDFPDDQTFMRKNRQNALVRAYVTLVSLFEMLTKESRRSSLQKSQGYSDDSLRQLNQLSQSNSSLEQLENVLRKLLEMDEIKSKNLMMKVAKIIQELNNNNNNSQNYLSSSIRNIPPLKFIP